MPDAITIRPAAAGETPLVLEFIRELAVYERLEHELVATVADLTAALVGPRPCAEVVFACLDGSPVGFALFCHTFSTLTGKPGIYLVDLFVRPPTLRSRDRQATVGVARAHRARARLRTARMGGARLERTLDRLLPQRRRGRAG